MTDLTYWEPFLRTAKDLNTWANPGPGAVRGASYIFGEIERSQEELYLDCINWLLEDTNKHFLSAHIPELKIRDIEHSLCEYSKYQKAYDGTGRPKQRYNGRRD